MLVFKFNANAVKEKQKDGDNDMLMDGPGGESPQASEGREDYRDDAYGSGDVRQALLSNNHHSRSNSNRYSAKQIPS